MRDAIFERPARSRRIQRSVVVGLLTLGMLAPLLATGHLPHAEAVAMIREATAYPFSTDLADAEAMAAKQRKPIFAVFS